MAESSKGNDAQNEPVSNELETADSQKDTILKLVDSHVDDRPTKRAKTANDKNVNLTAFTGECILI